MLDSACVQTLHSLLYYVRSIRAILRASSLNPSGVTITYIPCPQGYVPTIATNQYLSNESSGPSSPDNLGKTYFVCC